MKKNIIAIFLSSSFFCACNNSQPANQSEAPKADSVPQSPVKMVAARNARYCEILTVSGNIANLTATVYNTLGCNDCPDSAWMKADKEKIKKEFDAKSVVMNGPRFFLMDSIGQFNAAPPKVNIGGIDMVERAKLKVSLAMMSGKKEPYTEKQSTAARNMCLTKAATYMN